MDYFYHSSIKNYTIALLDLFNDIKVPRYNEDGELIELFDVPIEFGSRDKAYQLSKFEMEHIHNGNMNVLPKMILSFEGLEKDPKRETSAKAMFSDRDLMKKCSTKAEYVMNPVGYIFNFVLHIATRTFTDATIIIEQIAPMFRPSQNLKINELDIFDVATDVPVKIGNFDVVLPDRLDFEDIRIVKTTLPVKLVGNLYPPIMESKIISDIAVNIGKKEALKKKKGDKYNLDRDDREISQISHKHDKETGKTSGDVIHSDDQISCDKQVEKLEIDKKI